MNAKFRFTHARGRYRPLSETVARSLRVWAILGITGIAMIDWERVECLRAEIGEADFGEVVDLFLEEVEEVLGRLAAHVRPRQLEADLHFLKGSSLNLGFADLAALCQAEERRAAAGAPVDRAPVAALYAASKKAFLARLRLSGRHGQAA